MGMTWEGLRRRKRLVKRKTLAYVNRSRKEQGKPKLRYIPKGNPGYFQSCPIANAIDGEAYEDLIVYNRNGGRVVKNRVPMYITAFVTMFDNGEYPELVAGD